MILFFFFGEIMQWPNKDFCLIYTAIMLDIYTTLEKNSHWLSERLESLSMMRGFLNLYKIENCVKLNILYDCLCNKINNFWLLKDGHNIRLLQKSAKQKLPSRILVPSYKILCES